MKAKIEDVLAFLIATLLMGAVLSIPTTLALVLSSRFSWYEQLRLTWLLPAEDALNVAGVLQVWGEIALVLAGLFMVINWARRRRSFRADRNVRLSARR